MKLEYTRITEKQCRSSKYKHIDDIQLHNTNTINWKFVNKILRY